METIWWDKLVDACVHNPGTKTFQIGSKTKLAIIDANERMLKLERLVKGNPIKATGRYRAKLKGTICAKGYPSISAFSKASKIDPADLSKMIAGWQVPNPMIAEKLATTLQLSLSEIDNLFE